MRNWLHLFRVHQYIKNGFIFLPAFFAGHLESPTVLIDIVLAFFAFSLTASSIYIFNDFHDRNEDRLHPVKNMRPIASGAISPVSASWMMIILAVSGLLSMWCISHEATWILFIYLTINIAYSLYLKHISLLDVTIIAIGFVLRLFVGSFVSNNMLSMWIVIMTFLLALFLALAKRRDDLILFEKIGGKSRKSLDGYTLPFVDSIMMISAGIVVVSYILYTTSIDVTQRLHNNHLYLSSLFVIMGVFRYFQIAIVEEKSGSPTKIVLTDHFIQINVLCWLAFFFYVIYL